MQRRTKIPDKPRFDYATSRAYELLVQLDIGAFPINPYKIIEHFPQWNIAAYTVLQHRWGIDDPLNIDRDKAEAKTMIIRGSGEYLIVYDDRINNESRIRWTLAHEIGHIVLGHLVHFEATALNRRGLRATEYRTLEIEAHWFAAELLSPKTILKLFSFGESSDGISLICDISKEAAIKRLKQLKYQDYGYFTTENMIRRNFYDHISKEGFYGVVHEVAARYYGTYIYPKLCKECRICRQCNAYIGDEEHSYCYICGTAVPNVDRYSPRKPNQEGIFSIGYSFYMEGKYYPKFESEENERVKFCPVCKNHEFGDISLYCRICGTSTHNYCKAEDKVIPVSHRFCAECGSEAVFKELYETVTPKWELRDFALPTEFEDYIEYEYWDYVVMAIGYWKNDMQVYTALVDSVALRDGTDLIILTKNPRDKKITDSGSELICACMEEYGCAKIETVRCFCDL